MSETQTLSYTKASYTKALAATRLHIYQALFTISIIIGLVVGLWSLLDPVGFAQLLFQIDPYPEAWPRIWGATLLAVQFLYIPGVRNPLFYRWPNWSSISVKLLMTIIFLTNGASFHLLAVWEFIWFVILFVSYYRLMLADMQTNP